jgi:hypothetical protein
VLLAGVGLAPISCWCGAGWCATVCPPGVGLHPAAGVLYDWLGLVPSQQQQQQQQQAAAHLLVLCSGVVKQWRWWVVRGCGRCTCRRVVGVVI